MISIRVMDIRALDLNLLKAFDALMTERAVTRAAGRIGLSQPAMSHALSRLRDLFADDLFVRTGTRMEPTPRAREIASLVSPAIEHIEAALNLGARFDPAGSTAIFTAGMAEYAEVALVGKLAESFARQAPRATLRLSAVTGQDAADRLDSGTIDVAVAHMRTMPPRFETKHLMRDPFVLVARRGHRAIGGTLSAEAYAGLNHALVSPRGATVGAIDQTLTDLGLRRRVALLVSTYSALAAALISSDLVATLPYRAARQLAATAGIEFRPLPIDLSATVSLAWHRRAAGDAAQNWFRSLLIDAARD